MGADDPPDVAIDTEEERPVPERHARLELQLRAGERVVSERILPGIEEIATADLMGARGRVEAQRRVFVTHAWTDVHAAPLDLHHVDQVLHGYVVRDGEVRGEGACLRLPQPANGYRRRSGGIPQEACSLERYAPLPPTLSLTPLNDCERP